jgi:hypothetical protein
MKFVQLWIAIALAVTPAVADTAKEVSPNHAKAWLALFDKIVDAVVANRTECRTMAQDLDAIITANQDTIKVARDAKAQGKKLPASATQHLQDAMRRMIVALDKCGRDDRVAAAFARIDLGGRGAR